MTSGADSATGKPRASCACVRVPSATPSPRLGC